MSSVADDIGEGDRLRELERANRNLLRQLDRARRRDTDLVAAVYEAARDAAASIGAARPVTPPKSDRRRKREEWALVHATDWQVGKRTDTYDSDIAEQRIARFADKIVSLTEVQRAAHPVRRCALFLGGDMCEGVQIFPGQAWEVDSTLYEQLFRTARIEEMLVRRMLETFEQVEVWSVAGNHGRLGRRGDYPEQDNVDSIAYRVCSEQFKGEKRLRWHHQERFFQIAEIGNYRPLLVHGHQVKQFGGNFPGHGILRKFNAWSAGVLPEFTDGYMGHFHTPMTLVGANGRLLRLGGTPESGNEYATEFVAATGTPMQRLCFVDPERGRVTSEYLVHLGD